MDAKGADEDVFIIELMSFMCSPAFQAAFQGFYEAHGAQWQPPLDGEEHSHANHELFVEFKSMVETHISGFLRSKGIDEAAFVSRSRRAMEAAQGGAKHMKDADEAWSHVLLQLLAGTEFDSFCELMQQQHLECARAESKSGRK